jgi:hypothetical protein
MVPILREGLSALYDRQEGRLIVTGGDNPTARLGWRFTAGVVLIVGAYAAWSLIPVVVTSDLPAWAKSALAAVLGATPFMSKVAAVALMGRPAYDFFKRNVLKSLRLSSVRSRG